jgi:hypothetical protein
MESGPSGPRFGGKARKRLKKPFDPLIVLDVGHCYF